MSDQPSRVVKVETDPDPKRRYKRALGRVDEEHGYHAWYVNEVQLGPTTTKYIFTPMKARPRG